jgi:hypothetical protein
VLAAGKLVPALVRRLLLTASRIIPVPFGFLVDVGCLERPAHAYCMWHAAQLAQRRPRPASGRRWAGNPPKTGGPYWGSA